MAESFSIKGYADAKKLLHGLRSKSEQYWLSRGEAMALKLFHEMARRVPAYKDFLKKHKIVPSRVKNLSDFKKVPLLDKNNYLKAYPLADLCWDGKLDSKAMVFASTSGTTGEPFYFPRSALQDRQYALSAELYLLSNFHIDRKSTLYVNAFAMGSWIGGVFTYQAIRYIAEDGTYPLSIATPGVNKAEIIKVVKKLGDQYDQVIIGGYPPFIKDALDEGIIQGLNWKKYNLKFIFSAEGFSESFRDYIIKKAGLKNPLTDTLNHYGTVDLGTMSHETPVAILVRRLLVGAKKDYHKVFGQASRLPTLTQFLPEMFFFEDLNGDLICSANSGLPLVRYDLKDRGGVFTFKDLQEKLPGLKSEVKKASIVDTLWNIPFVYVYERSDMVVSWYGANIYPEHVREAHHQPVLSQHLTGKFTIEIQVDRKHEPVLVIYSEMKKGLRGSEQLLKKLKQTILEVLFKKNSEFKNSYMALPEKKRDPKIFVRPYESAPHFTGSGKQRWVIK